MLELYHTPQSTCSQKVRLALAEKLVAWSERRMDWLKGEHLEDWYLDLNPNGTVPTLVHDGEPVVDSTVINEYIEELFPEPPLMPADPLKRARMRTWRQFIDEVPTVAIRVPSFNHSLVKLWQDMSPSEFEAFAARHPIRADFYRTMGTSGFSDEDVERSLRRLSHTLMRMEHSLQRGGPWLIGRDFTLADISILPTIVRMEDLGLAHQWSPFPAVQDWYARIQLRPSFAAVYQGETRNLPTEKTVAAMSGKREPPGAAAIRHAG